MQDQEKDDAVRRLKIAEGHLRGIQKMVENDDYCIDIIRQLQAVQSALNKVSSQLLNSHVNSCLVNAIQNNDIAERERVLQELVDVFEASKKS